MPRLGFLPPFSSSFAAMRLRSLVLEIDFRGFDISQNYSDHLSATAAESLAEALEPACDDLQSLTIHLRWFNPHRRPPQMDAFKYLISIGHSTISILKLRGFESRNWDMSLMSSLKDLVAAQSFASYPGLRHFSLDGFGISADAFRQMRCLNLEHLEVILAWPPWPGEDDEIYELVNSLALCELDKLQSLDVKFRDLGLDTIELALGWHWDETSAHWEAVEDGCAARGIRCTIDPPAQTRNFGYDEGGGDDEGEREGEAG